MHNFGRSAFFHARLSAAAARYRPEPPLRVISRLMVAALRLSETVEDALVDYAPSHLANYLFSIAQLANEFYHSHPVSQEPDAGTRSIRIALVALVALTLSRGLNLLGIQTPEEM